MNRKISYLSLGSNLGDRENYLLRAIKKIITYPNNLLLKVSSIYETEPWGMKNTKYAPRFLNQCIKMETTLTPFELLEFLESIEKDLGRVKKNNCESRTIDLDILLYGDEIVCAPKLQIPHRHMHKRKFVLLPLLEIEPSLQDPVSGKRYASILEVLKD
ncbi:MAG: 2-amino-4-hydroxy-6-hydroxymethyldihydropteridine diphosphokinase [Patescibacteria group bacterium]